MSGNLPALYRADSLTQRAGAPCPAGIAADREPRLIAA